jgi:hypothetical protein
MRANPFSGFALFVLMIYVISKDWLQVVLLVRYSNKEAGHNF